MNREQDKYSGLEEQGSHPKFASLVPGESFHGPIGQLAMNWEYPDFEVLDLCMEVTAYIYHWQ